MIFGTSGARGFIDKNLTPSLVYKLTVAYYYFAKPSSVVLGQDDRPQSTVLKDAVESALLAMGVDVYDAGVSPTPGTVRLMKELHANGAISITGSHTPPYIAGVLYFLKDTGELGVKDSQRVESIYYRIKERPKSWRRLGRKEVLSDPVSIYVGSIKRDVGRLHPYRIVLDAANGAISAFAKGVFEDLGIQAEIVNGSPLGSFPSRLPSPIPQHLEGFRRMVREMKTDFGVATDSDGDRAIFINGEGQIILGDTAGAYFAERALTQKGSVVTPINSSDSIIIVARRHRARIIWTRVGPPAIVDALRKHREAVFAFEESGKYIWPGILLYGDAVFSTLKAMEDGDFERNIGRVPRFYVVKREVRSSDEIKYRAVESVDAKLNVKKIKKDGIKAFFGSHRWLLIRASGTEPVIRVFGHSRIRRDAEEIAAKGVEMVREAKRALSASE
ncbi:MAG: hypothetical protein ACP5LW_04155 [Nitrososphaeria archaeon]